MADNHQQNKPFSPWLIYLVSATIFVILYTSILRPAAFDPIYRVAYSEFKALVNENLVTEIVLRGKNVDGKLEHLVAIGPNGEESRRFKTRVPSFGDETLLPELEEKGVLVWVGEEPGENLWAGLLMSLLPWLIFLGIFIWLLQRTGRNLSGRFGGSNGLKDFLDPSAKKAVIPDVTFTDVAGQENAKREVMELVEYLRNPAKFQRLGAEIPKGILLMGSPGTGKTLLAKALAGEASVPFYSISASEFIEIYVGVGASRVRHLFEAAKKNAPSIIFIDELDSVGRTRGAGIGGGHDEREQTLNQILAELDGFSGREAVLVLAATNRPDVLDAALLRPGRFDRHVTLDLPDRKDRTAILKVHTRNTPIADSVDLDTVSAGTAGFSGADLKNLVNEAAILAARRDENEISMQDFEDSRDKVLMGAERSLVIQPEEKHRLAVHEAGHTIMAYYLPLADALYKVSIIPRGQALGATEQLPEHERQTLPEDYLNDRLTVMLGGRAAEKALMGTLSSGADNDIQQATQMARAMVSRWGMSDDIGPIDLRDSEEHPFLGREMAQPRHYSEHSAEVVDDAVRELLIKAEKRATEIIAKHRPQLDKLISELEERETLHKEDIKKCLGPSENIPNNKKIATLNFK